MYKIPIRILQIVSTMDMGGIETMLMNYYRSIDRSEIQFDFLVHREQVGYYEEEILSLGGRIYRAPRLSPKTILTYSKWLKTFYEDHDEYRIVHSHLDALSGIPLRIAKAANIPNRIAHVHTSNFNFDNKFIMRKILSRFLPLYASHLMACSNQAGKFYYGKKDFVVLPNSIDVERFKYDEGARIKLRNELNLGSKIAIGHIGAFRKEKNHKFIIRLAEEIKKKRLNYKVLLIGDGALRNEIEILAHKKNLREYVQFLGLRSDVNKWMSAFDVLIMPSIYEGLSLALVEAQANGLMCIASTRVARDVNLTPLVKNLELNDLNSWIEQLGRASMAARTMYYDDMLNSAYSIKNSTNMLSDNYKRMYDGL